MIPDYILDIGQVDDICRDFIGHIRKEFFTSTDGTWQDYATPYHWPYLPSARSYIIHLSQLIEICDLFGVKGLESEKQELQRRVHMLEEEREETRRWKLLDVLIRDIVKPFADFRYELRMLRERLKPKEKERVNEAIHVYLEKAYYSSVAMSVSAIEHRLLTLMKMVNPAEAARLDEMTLGALITEYLHHEKDKYQNLLLSRHKPLLQLCNAYRIFSVHPKEQEIDRKVATSVLNLTLEFLLDKLTIIPEEIPRE